MRQNNNLLCVTKHRSATGRGVFLFMINISLFLSLICYLLLPRAINARIAVSKHNQDIKNEQGIQMIQKISADNTSACMRINTKQVTFCASTVTWPIHRYTYVNQQASDQVAIDYYHYVLNIAGNDTTEDCKAAAKLVSCGRSFTRCVSEYAPAIQLCKRECIDLTRKCGDNITYDMIANSCRQGSGLTTDCHSSALSAYAKNTRYYATLATLLFTMLLKLL